MHLGQYRFRVTGGVSSWSHAVAALFGVMLCWLAGCGGIIRDGFDAVPAYGVPDPPSDPTVAITSFSYTPAEAIKLGDTIHFEAKVNKEWVGGRDLPLMVYFDGHTFLPGYTGPAVQYFRLNDFGIEGDAEAGDLVYSGEVKWEQALGPVEHLPVTAIIWWTDAPHVEFSGLPLTITDPTAEE
jgi:hypothetical protein